jgi:hypothetical protein
MDIICHRNSYSFLYVKYSCLIWCNQSVDWDVRTCSCLITSMGCTAVWRTQYDIVIHTRSYMLSILVSFDVSSWWAKRRIPCRVSTDKVFNIIYFHCIVSSIVVLSQWIKRYITRGVATLFTLGIKKSLYSRAHPEGRFRRNLCRVYFHFALPIDQSQHRR